MTDALGHRCRAAEHCVAKSADGAAITPKPNTVCSGCVRRLQSQLEQLPHLASALESFKAGSLTGTHGSKVNATPTPSAPLNLTVVDLITDIRRVISRAGGQTVRVSDLIGKPAGLFTVWRGGRCGGQFLDGVDRALAIGEVWRKADKIVGLSRAWERRRTPCPRCNLPTLGMFVGGESVHCTNAACSRSYTLSEYEHLCLARVELQKIEKKEKIR